MIEIEYRLIRLDGEGEIYARAVLRDGAVIGNQTPGAPVRTGQVFLFFVLGRGFRAGAKAHAKAEREQQAQKFFYGVHGSLVSFRIRAFKQFQYFVVSQLDLAEAHKNAVGRGGRFSGRKRMLSSSGVMSSITRLPET